MSNSPMSPMSLLLNLLWIVFGGLWMAVGWVFAAVIIGGASFFGGVGTVGGTLVGALIMAVLRNGLNLLNVSASWQTVVIGVVIVGAVLVDVVRKRAAERAQSAAA